MRGPEAVAKAFGAILREFGSPSAALADLAGSPAPWAFAACGSTALGLEAAAAGQAGTAAPIIRSNYDYNRLMPRAAAGMGVLGLSFSGGSSEVLEILARAASEGRPTAFASRAASPQVGTAALLLGLEEVPRRLLPLAAWSLARVLSGRSLPPGPPPLLRGEAEGGYGGLLDFLADATEKGLVPLFIAEGPPLPATTLASQYMEFLKRPAFSLSFPEWTHDLLWALRPGDGRRHAVVHLEPAADLADGRLAKSLGRVAELGLPLLRLVAPGPASPDWGGGSALAHALSLYWDLAGRIGVDPEEEGSFAYSPGN